MLSHQKCAIKIIIIITAIFSVPTICGPTDSTVPAKNLETLDSPDRDKLLQIFKYIDSSKEKFLEHLRDDVSVPSLSCVEDTSHCLRMISTTVSRLEGLGFKTQQLDVGDWTKDDGSGDKISLPPAILATLGTEKPDEKKKTLLFYGHLDVVPAHKSDGWDTDPFNLTEARGNLYGRGSTDDKGQLLAWLHAIESFHETGVELPLNLKALLECSEECGSPGLGKALAKVKHSFLQDIDAITISDTYWLGRERPCLIYGTRGIAYFFVEVEGGIKDLHSGTFGGAVQEALPDLIWLLSQLVDEKGKILIPNLSDDVRPLTAEEKESYEKVEFDLEDFKSEAGVWGLINSKTKEDILMSRWRFPSLSFHGIEGAFSEPGGKTVIPRKVTGKFSIRLVPDQDPDRIVKVVKAYLNKLWEGRGSPNKLRVTVESLSKPWVANFTHPNYVAAALATELVYGVKPMYIREGNTIPIVSDLQELTGKNILHLPLGQSDDGAHSQNEKISRRNYFLGTKLVAAYLLQLGKQLGEKTQT